MEACKGLTQNLAEWLRLAVFQKRIFSLIHVVEFIQ